MRVVAYARVSTAPRRKRSRDCGPAPGNRELLRRKERNDPRTLQRSGEQALSDRPELANALHLAKVKGAVLVFAKLDRLSRNASFLLTLRDSGARFAAVDLPEANDFTVRIMALVAQQEREVISRRTKEALSVARSRGVRLGNPNGAEAHRRAGKGAQALRVAVVANATCTP
jgi:DNA invertase Pin-like site-specific DNA recombinase